jgi:hypothetical protein
MKLFEASFKVSGKHTKDVKINKIDPDTDGNPNVMRTFKVYCEHCHNDEDYCVLTPNYKFDWVQCRKCGHKLSALYEVD